MDLDDAAQETARDRVGRGYLRLSAHELEKRIARLEEEIARCAAAIKDRRPPNPRRRAFSRSEASQRN
jgi:uncharacterized small protein (DUF1192 family)